MTRNNLVNSINCTSCGAGLDILGGGRVVVHVCGYCGSALDSQDNYKVLKELGEMPRPNSPFKLGMVGKIQGVEFTIIGTLGLEERYHGRTWKWVDHQLFSPTHGYAFLTVEDGHFIFTRRYRKGLSLGWLSPHTVERAETKPVVYAGNDRYVYYETSTSEATFVEGEFNWQPKLAEREISVSVLSDDAMLTFTQTATEREVERSTYLEHDQTQADFGIKNTPGPRNVHPVQAYKAHKNENFLKRAAIGCAIVTCLLVFILMGQSGGQRTAFEHIQITNLPVEIPVVITTKERLAMVRISGDVDNSWAYLGFALMDPEDEPVFEAGREIEKYSGRDHEGKWSEGSGFASLRFIPRQTGTYSLEIALEEADTWERSGAPLTKVTVEVVEAVSSPFYMMILAMAFLLMAGIPFGRYYLYERRRWWGSDWVEEDD